MQFYFLSNKYLFYFMHLIYRDLFLRYSIYPIQAHRRVEDDNRVQKKGPETNVRMDRRQTQVHFVV